MSSMNKLYTLLIVEDQHILRMGLRAALEGTGCCSIVGEADDGETAVREAVRLGPDVIMMDIGLPGIDGIEATWRIKKELPRTRVIMFTSRKESDIISSAFGAGADGYCVKDAPVSQIMSAIETVCRGETYLDSEIADCVVQSQKNLGASAVELSASELQLLVLIKDEIKRDQIAARLNMDSEHVAHIIHNVISKFVIKKLMAERYEQKERKQLNKWLTAFKENLDCESVFNEKYVMESLIGAGGIGAVFRARHLYIDKLVAIKLLHSDLVEDRLLMRGFQREGTAVASLSHKNIISVFDFGLSDDRQPYLVMEYIEGKSLAEVISREGRLEQSRVLNLFAQICNGLKAAHARGIIHCDLKPSNILISDSDDGELVKLVDFGLVQTLPQKTLSQLQATEKYMISGTPTYMSPEQCLGKPLDERSDIYSLGCVIFETLTGQAVFEANTALEIFAHHLQSAAPSLQSTCPTIGYSPELEYIVSCMLAKDPDDRPQTISEVSKHIGKCMATEPIGFGGNSK